ncbi:hypothetical protein NZ35_24010 [Pseudomonas chlororaphis]|uniref:Uncharacterized protein n=1 Tax=Pseudomonas chlororaphis TaxID=587753 RepID=A0A0A6D845_9PSED|nr:hypothetical protein NZ35_24010 [Pseudomonas chlororaphis]
MYVRLDLHGGCLDDWSPRAGHQAPGMSRMDPAYRLYGRLLQHAKDNVDQQADERRAMELQDE